MQLINSTVIRELSTVIFSGSLNPGAYIWGAYIRGLIYISVGFQPAACGQGPYIPGAYIRELIPGGLYPGTYIGGLISGGIYPGGL